ncbi:MAG TPA: adenylate/guanylate cyclase domain-containing protein [Lacipirellulaceae bacterium]|nr:adenylate/guanylate cyclase domain-containing protein [Lacipirellulaceae bacterium]
MERRLAAVFIADVAGYGLLSQADEEGTRATFQADLHEVFEPKIAAHQGRLVKTMGDALLVEFHSVVDALRCAIEVQRAQFERNAGRPPDRQLIFRIGINLGDVMVEEDDIHGDSVNIAHRLQSMAEPGGITISGTAYDHVKGKLAAGFESLGEQAIKNVAEPVRVYRVLLDPVKVSRTVSKPTRSSRRNSPIFAAAAIVLVVGAGSVAWWRPWASKVEPASIGRMALPLPDKPSIAVLPFANMSDDPKQEYFIDGMTDGLITELSQVSGLFVIARNSTFAYKGKAPPPRQVAEELGVRYVLEGSVQRAGDQLRINAQLINAVSGDHEWAGKFDGSLADVFALQDKVARSITDALALRLTPEEQLVMGRKETTVPAAYDAFLRGWEHHRRTTPEDFAKAIPYFDEAIALDPNYGRAYEAAAMVYARTYIWGWSQNLGLSRREVRSRARQYLQKAQAYRTALTHQVNGILLESEWEHAPALAELKEAIALEPGDSWSYAVMAFTLTSVGRPAEAIPYIRTALRLDPHYPSFFIFVLGLTEFSLEHFEAAATAAENSVAINPKDENAFLLLAATYGHLGRRQDAEAAIARSNDLRVGRGDVPITISTSPPLDLSKQQDSARLFQGLRLAGVPESLLSEEFSGNKLTADEIRSLLFGHRLHGRTFQSGAEHAAAITKEGNGTLTGDWEAMGGGGTADVEVSFKGDKLCFLCG